MSERRIRRGAAVLSAALPMLLLAGLAGCCPDKHVKIGVPPRDAFEAIERINRNLGRFDAGDSQQPRTLSCAARVSFRFRDAQGVQRNFLQHDARLIFRPDRCLIFDVRSLAGTIAQFGSNDERYWVWIEPELRKLWWGSWELVDSARVRRLPVPPPDLLDALMLRPIPMQLAGGLAPLLRIEGADQRLLLIRLSAAGVPEGWREIQLQPDEPYLPTRISDWTARGQLLMSAVLDGYQRVETDGPYTARRYRVSWPLDDAELSVVIDRARWRTGLEDFCTFPSNWMGEVEQIDAEPGPRVE